MSARKVASAASSGPRRNDPLTLLPREFHTLNTNAAATERKQVKERGFFAGEHQSGACACKRGLADGGVFDARQPDRISPNVAAQNSDS